MKSKGTAHDAGLVKLLLCEVKPEGPKVEESGEILIMVQRLKRAQVYG